MNEHTSSFLNLLLLFQYSNWITMYYARQNVTNNILFLLLGFHRR